MKDLQAIMQLADELGYETKDLKKVNEFLALAD